MPISSSSISQAIIYGLIFLAVNAQLNVYAQKQAHEKLNLQAVEIINSKCISCHGPDIQEGGLRLDSRDNILKGGKHGASISLEKPETSLLLQAIKHTDPELSMPPKDKLSDAQIKILSDWVINKAEWPLQKINHSNTMTSTGSAFNDPQNPIRQKFQGERLDLWSLKPPLEPAIPPVKQQTKNPIDNFILQKLETQEMYLSDEADKHTLVRRLYYDLWGLPPAPEEVQNFLQDTDPQAYEKLVDKLLNDVRYAEHLARLWLDVVRYADTNGFERDEFRPLIYRYRDYVIKSFHEDKPYNIFLTEQLAGDELVPQHPQNQQDIDRLIATGYLRLGQFDSLTDQFEEQAKGKNELHTDLVNTTGSAMLGLTLSCCNCHDHKYDPLLQEDHFRFRAFFTGAHPTNELIINLPEERKRIEAQHLELKPDIESCEQQLRKLQEKNNKNKNDEHQIQELESKLNKLNSEKLPYTYAMGTEDHGEAAAETHLFFQGDFKSPRQLVKAGFFSYLDPRPVAINKDLSPGSSSHRSTLAKWITSPENPFTSRVIVNRLWARLLGTGIVATTNDFGYSGTKPTHPELLDYLACQFTKTDWSLKKLQRTILLSATYKQSSLNKEKNISVDPENHLLWRQNPRRLTAEMLRDSMLQISGELLNHSGGPPLWPPVPEEILLAEPAYLETQMDQSAKNRLQGYYPDPLEKTYVRTIYLVQKRQVPLLFLRPFDLPDSTVSCGLRNQTLVATQSLNLLNSDFTLTMSSSMAKLIIKEVGQEPEKQAQRAMWLAFQRPPNSKENELAHKLLSSHTQYYQKQNQPESHQLALEDLCRTLMNLNQFITYD